jgi:hypothetical protein
MIALFHKILHRYTAVPDTLTAALVLEARIIPFAFAEYHKVRSHFDVQKVLAFMRKMAPGAQSTNLTLYTAVRKHLLEILEMGDVYKWTL